MLDMTKLVGATLKKLFPDIAIYREQTEHGFVEPSFFVHLVDVDMRKELNHFYWYDYGFQVIYFPKDENSNEELDHVRLQLLNDFEIIGNNEARAKKLSIEKDDGVLKIMFNVSIEVDKTPIEVKQNKLILGEESLRD